MNFFKKKQESKQESKPDGWQSTQFFGQGVEWKCNTCGEHSNRLRNGIGACCSPEIQQQIKQEAESEQRRRDLVWALQSRVLTDEEMSQVAALDYHILVQQMQSYNETEKRKQFGEMLLLQFKMRVAAKGIS